MKLIINICITFIVIIFLIVVAAFIFISTFDLNKYLEPIKQQASSALGRDVQIAQGNLKLDIFKGIDLNLKNVTIAEDPAFGKDPFLTLGELNASLDTKALITKREIILTSLALSNVHVNIIKDEKGAINAANIGPKSAAPVASTATESTPAPASSSSSAPALPALLVKRITVTEGNLIYMDKNPAMPMQIPIEHVSIGIDNFSLVEAFPATVKAAILAKDANIEGTMNIVVNVANQSAVIKDTQAHSNLALLDMGKVKAALPSLSQIPWPSTVNGALGVTLAPFTVSAKGLSGIDAKVDIIEALLKVLDYPVSFKSIHSEVKVDLTTPQLNGRINALISGGEIQNFNVTNAILKSLEGVAIVGPILSGVLQGNIAALELPDKTLINTVTLNSNIVNGVMDINKFNVDTPTLIVDAKGKFGLSDMVVDVPTDVLLTADLSTRLVKSVNPFKGLVNEKGMIYIPGKLSGIVPKVSYSPDVNYITKKVGTTEAADALGKQLDKVIEKNPEVGSILNSIFGSTTPASTENGQSNVSEGDSNNNSSEKIKGFLNKVLK